jgi:large subunit ribosomal protein L35
MKTHSSLKDRIKITGTGKVRRYKAYQNHLMNGKGKSQKQRLGKSPVMATGDVARLKQQISNLK